MKYIFMLLFLTLFSCEKPLKNPETVDLIYNDLQAEISKIDAEIGAQKALMQEKQDEMTKAQPQTGQFTYHNKKYWGIKAIVEKLQQRKLQLEIQLQLRQKAARSEYADIWIAKKPWPNQDAYSNYLKMKRPFGVRKDWDIKGRLKEYEDQLKSTNTRAPSSSKSH